MPRKDVTLSTDDGACPASVFTPPDQPGPWPGVIFFMDGLGIRPALWEMAQQLADAGYLVLLPDLYYRMGGYAQMDPHEVFSDPRAKEDMLEQVHSLDRERKVIDARACVRWLAGDARVRGDRYGAVGYCIGGQCALIAAGALPDRFAAVASFHAGNLVTEDPDSPHRFVQGIRARVYVAGAIEDRRFTDAQKRQLEKALAAADVPHTVETYDHARHGFAVSDMPLYNPSAAKRHWTALLSLFEQTL